MKTTERTLISLNSLLFISIVSMVVWRYEISLYGWEGLEWLSIPHHSVDFGLCLYALWCSMVIPSLSWQKRILLLVSQIILSYPIYGLFKLSLYGYFSFGPTAMFLGIFGILFIPMLLAIPIMQFFMLKIFKVQFRRRALFISTLSFLGAFPLSWVIVRLFSDYNYDVLIHAFKTGFIIPFFMLSLGSQCLLAKSPNQRLLLTNTIDEVMEVSDK
jgi:hypothetical protein